MPDSYTDDDLIAAWLDAYSCTGDSASSWASSELDFDLVYEQPERAWPIILELIRRAPDEEITKGKAAIIVVITFEPGVQRQRNPNGDERGRVEDDAEEDPELDAHLGQAIDRRARALDYATREDLYSCHQRVAELIEATVEKKTAR